MTPRTRNLLVAVALCAAVPLLVVAGIPVPPASQAACCNTADQPPPPVSNGDEAFFSIPGGVPNVMLIIDDSGSMMDLPRVIGAYPAFGANGGSCSGHWLNTFTAKRKNTPYDNGFNTGLVVDDPPWGLTKCQAKQAEPTTDGTLDWCQFRPTSYYKSYNDTNGIQGVTATQATVYNANPCAAIDSNGNVIQDYSTGVAKPALAKSVTECMDCLRDAGFYMFQVNYKNSSGNNRTSGQQIVFKGDFLNGFPPKFIAARKVVKDIAKIDAAAPRNTDQVRLGLTAFNTNDSSSTGTSLGSSDGGKLLVPLGPSCDQSFPPSTATFATSRQVIINAVNAVNATATAPTYLTFDTFTPLAETLFNVGQYFSNTGTTALYQTNFGTGWMRTSTTNAALNFQESSVGAVNAAWASSSSQHSYCWACQTSSVVLVTDGAPTNDTNLPSGRSSTNHPNLFDNLSSTKTYDFRRWTNATIDCATCGGALLPKVAYFLNQSDLRPDLADTPRPQSVSVYTISFGLDPVTDATAIAVLQKTATLGGGDFFATDDADSLAAAMDTAVSSVVARATAFSSANTNSIQLSKTSGADAYLGRFRPANATMWEGHLFAAQIFDEFGQGCDERFTTAAQATFSCGTDSAKNPNIDGDEFPTGHPQVGKAICSSVYLVDQDCDPIVEDSTGSFKKGHFDPTTHQLVSDPDAALMYWDAGKALSDATDPGYRSADETSTNTRRRVLYTTIDVNGDGKLTSADGLVEFTSANAAALAPMMNLPVAPAAGIAWDCKTWLNTIGVCGTAPLPACPATATDLRTKCAEQIINFYRGYDVMDWDNDHCSGPGAYYNTNGWGSCTTNANCGAEATCSSGKCVNNNCTASGEQRDRARDSRSVANQEFWKLGDIFHSSPVLVKPPLDKALCALRNTQCQPTIYSAVFSGAAATPTPMATSGGLDAYDIWRRSIVNRQQLVVVGANDMMFHAFDAGVADTGKTAGPDGQFPFTQGTGAELWAFIPPDLLPRLKEGLVTHAYGVDGSTMVKDIWVDLNGDGRKQSNEFKTIAVITERGGGSRWTALDITNPTAPAFLWTFPETCTDDAKLMAQSFSDFLPRPSPVLPVRLALPVGSPKDPLNRGFEERWIVMVNGGYDPALVRGRAVWMLDAWTGKWLWRYTDADFKAMRQDNKATMFPVAAAIGLIDLGGGNSSTGTYDKDGYFDTATWGDLGGNLFVARFHVPGTLDNAGHVTNWTAARSFETQRQSDDSMKITDRGEVFFMTGNGIDPGNTGRLITTFGTGNRERLMQTSNSCGPDNVAACCWSGCTVTAAATSTVGTCTQGGTFQCSSSGLTFTPAATAGCGVQGSPHTCAASSNRVDLTFACGALGTRTITANLVCGSDGVCTTEAPSSNAEFSTASLAQPKPQYRAYGFWSYGVAPARKFSTVAEAKVFEGQRATDVTFAGCTASPSGNCKLMDTSPAQVSLGAAGLATTCRGGVTSCSVGPSDLGWMYSYGKFCPMETCTPATWDDERTGTAVVPFSSCTTWSGFRPTGAAAGTDPCTSATGSPSSNSYSLDAFSGLPRKGCGVEDTSPGLSYYAATQRNALAAPQNASIRYVMNQRGQINTSLLKIETGSPAQKQSLNTRNSLAQPLYWLEVPKAVHNCRHVDPSTCK